MSKLLQEVTQARRHLGCILWLLALSTLGAGLTVTWVFLEIALRTTIRR